MLECWNVGMVECWNGGLEGLGGLESLEGKMSILELELTTIH